MPIHFARRLTGHQRSIDANRHLGVTLAFIAGAINAGGFLAVQQYTSHMTGIVSGMADQLALGNHALVLAGFGAILSFLTGAACTALMVSHARLHRLHSEYALPLLLEAMLLLGFGLLGGWLSAIDGLFVVEDVQNFGADYDRTCVEWFTNFDAAWPRLRDRYGPRFYRMWKYYLLSAAGAFRSRKYQLWQFVLSKRGVRGGYVSVR